MGTEQLRNNRIIIYFPYCLFILKLGAVFRTKLTNESINPPFQLTCVKIGLKIDSLNKFAITITAINTERDFTNERFFPYVFRRNQSGDVTRIHAKLLCYFAVSHWTETERLCSHLIHSPQ